MLLNGPIIPDSKHVSSVFSFGTKRDNLFVPILGQSNGASMSQVYEPYQLGATSNEDSGAIILDRELTSLSGRNIITSDTSETNFSVGGSKVNGNGGYQDDSTVWWYPESSQPGGALRQAEQGLENWLADGGAQPSDEIAVIWSQGESDIGDVGMGDAQAREQYKQSTLAVFDHLRSNLGYANIKFYLVPTGRIQTEGAANRGLSESAIEAMSQGTEIIRGVQSEIALERDDVQLAPDYSDLNMVYEEGQIYGDSYDKDYGSWSTDFLHLGHDGLKINGDRLAQYIAVDRGESNVISFTDSFGNPATSISLPRAGLLDLNISANPSPGLIQGTDLPDVVVGTVAPDEISSGAGNDLIVATPGVDTLTGGSGADVFFYESIADSDRILDFEITSDRLDVSELLTQANYTGSQPIADGYLTVTPITETSLEVKFDSDGLGSSPASAIATLENVNPLAFEQELSAQLITIPTEF